MKNVFFYPPINNDHTNDYLKNLSSILEREFNICNLPVTRQFFDLFFEKKSKDVVILNWYEDFCSSAKLPVFFLHVFYLLYIRLAFKKIIWVKHNFKPHGHRNYRRYSFINFIMSKVSDSCVTHRPIENCEFLPHPMYSVYNSNESNNRDIKFLIFGQIKRYKGIVGLLEIWPGYLPLTIAGSCDDKKLMDELLSLISQRSLDVTLINSFLTKVDLDNLLTRAETVLLPHVDKSIVVSGAFYHASSAGCNVALFYGPLYEFLSENFSHVHLIDDIYKSRYRYNKDVDVLESIKKHSSSDIILNKTIKIVSGGFNG